MAPSTQVAHADVKVVPHDPAPARPNCAGCHDDAIKEYATSIHAVAKGKGDKAAPWCTDCHGPAHSILPKTDPSSRTYHLRIPQTCARCHENAVITKQHPMPSPQKIEQYFGSVHGKGALDKGLMVSAVCSDCHGAHDILSPSDPSSRVFPTNIPRTCGSVT